MWKENFKNWLIGWLIRHTHIHQTTMYFMLYSLPLPITKTLLRQVEENTDNELANYFRPIRFVKHPEWRNHGEP